jgi:hypothetical protein
MVPHLIALILKVTLPANLLDARLMYDLSNAEGGRNC